LKRDGAFRLGAEPDDRSVRRHVADDVSEREAGVAVEADGAAERAGRSAEDKGKRQAGFGRVLKESASRERHENDVAIAQPCRNGEERSRGY